MAPNTHPSQKRSACERCRKQKLRCSRQDSEDATCARCARLGAECLAGQQRKIGRPSRHAATEPLTPETSTDAAMHGPVEPATHEPPEPAVREPSESAVVAVPSGFSTAFDAHFDLANMDGTFEWTGQPPSPMMFLPTPPPALLCVPGLPSARHELFLALSRVNVDLHRDTARVQECASALTFASFVCSGHELLSVGGITITERIEMATQELLRVLGALRRLASEHEGACLDTPLALVVISCYVQIIGLYETLWSHIQPHLSTVRENPPDSLDWISFGAVALNDSFLQGIMFVQIVTHSLDRIAGLLGMPTEPSRAARSGLLSRGQLALLWAELGSPRADWSERPSALRRNLKSIKRALVAASQP